MTDQIQTLPYRPCVGLMILNPDQQIWVGRRADANRKRPNYGAWWQMPQGGIDQGEDPEAAALRELTEETGIQTESVEIIAESQNWLTYDLPPELVGHVWKGRYGGQKQKWFALRFHGADDDISITPDDPKMIEFDAWRWAARAEVLDLIVPFKRDVYEAVLEEFAPLLPGP
jgi:putative (di)nucleoside polyphosphate hydrolase